MSIFAFKERVRKGIIHSLKKSGSVLISDTTLREDEQMPDHKKALMPLWCDGG